MAAHENILQVRSAAVNFHVLRADDGLYLIDTGFWGGPSFLQRALERRGWQEIPLKGIILTHGHLDHVLNVAVFAERSGAWVAAPRLDREYYLGRYHYHGVARVCGILEALGRAVSRYRTFAVDHWLDDGSEIGPGLTAVHLPGHTEGHCGFYDRSLRLLFCGDLFASGRFAFGLPPAIFNSCPEFFPASLDKIMSLDLAGILPNHGDAAAPEEHLRRFQKFIAARR